MLTLLVWTLINSISNVIHCVYAFNLRLSHSWLYEKILVLRLLQLGSEWTPGARQPNIFNVPCWALMLFSERPPIYASCMTISGGRTKQLYIIAGWLLRHWLYEWFFRPPKMSADICVVHDDLWWKNRTIRYNRFWRAGCNRLEYVDIRSVC